MKTLMNKSLKIEQLRWKRKVAYPCYQRISENVRSSSNEERKDFFIKLFKDWLGPVNVRGEYYKNKYFYPLQNHKPNYIVPDGNTILEDNKNFNNTTDKVLGRERDSHLNPFPLNIYCKTANIVSDEMKMKIYNSHIEEKMDFLQISTKYGLEISRVKAIITLKKIENEWHDNNKITKDLKKLSDLMFNFFPVHNPKLGNDFLTEIPTINKTLDQRFLMLSESEPFGPIEASKLYKLDSSNKILKKNNYAIANEDEEKELRKVIIGKIREKDRFIFKFFSSKAGVVGYRYGSSMRDNKKDRRIGFDRNGKLLILGTTYTFVLNPLDISCYYLDTVKPNVQIIFYFAVQNGGDFDIDYTVRDPNKKIVTSENKKRQIDIIFTGKFPGEYEFCFSNTMSTFADKTVDFEIKIEDESDFIETNKIYKDDQESKILLIDKVQQSVKTFDKNFDIILRNIQYYKTRNARNFSTVKSTSNRIFYFSLLEVSLMIGITLSQIVIIQLFFKGSRKHLV